MTDYDESYRRIQAEAYCNHVRGLRLRCEDEQANYQEQLEAIDGIKAVRYDRQGGRPTMEHGDDAMAEAIDRLMATGNAMVERIVAWTAELEQFDALCRRVTPQSGRVLKLRYRDCMKWDDVADAMGYASDYVRRELRERALDELYTVLPLSWK